MFNSSSPAAARGLLTIDDPAAAPMIGAAQSMLGTAAAVSRAQNSLSSLTRALAALQAVQTAAHNLVIAAPSAVPDGLVAGGLTPDSGLAAPGVANPVVTWTGARTPTQTTADGATAVTVQQTAAKAILNWRSFNVGARTTVTFNQQGNANWVALNRISASGVPSQILGKIRATGQVYLIDPNGIIFGGSSQLNVNALIASSASIDPARFAATGIYSTQSNNSYTPSFTGAGAPVTVEAGARIDTNTPSLVTSGGGFVLLMGTQVRNAGQITTPDGQAELAAGDNFLLRPGYGTATGQTSTTVGNEVAVQIITRGSSKTGGSGLVSNTGLLTATTGDITLAGETVIQGGAAVATTSVDARGTIHLLSSAADPEASVTLTPGSLTAILPDAAGATALNAQRASLIAASAIANVDRATLVDPQFDDLGTLADLRDESRVEIVTGGVADFQKGSQTVAPGGQIAVQAAARVLVESAAVLDVSGAIAQLPVTASQIIVSIEGAELADAPAARTGGVLKNNNVYVDVNGVIEVPAGTGGDATARDYTPGGLLEVSGELSNITHGINEWLSSGGTITLATQAGGAVVAQPGSIFDIRGGALTYQSGYLPQSYVLARNGQIYNINNAPASLDYLGIFEGFVDNHAHWGVSQTYADGLHTPGRIYQPAYVVGRDAGSLMLSTPTSVFEGNVNAGVIEGSSQIITRPASVTDPFLLGVGVVPIAGSLALGQYNAAGIAGAYETAAVFGAARASAAASLGAGGALPAGLAGTAYFDAAQISSEGLGGLDVTTARSIAIDAPVTLAAGGAVALTAARIEIGAALTARSGKVYITNILQTDQPLTGPAVFGGTAPGAEAALAALAPGAVIDTRGIWTNGLLDPTDLSNLAFVNGGNVSIDMSQGVNLAAGSVIDASSGAAILPNSKQASGRGGNIALVADDGGAGIGGTAPLVLDGTLKSYGVSRGGILTLQTNQGIYISNQPNLSTRLTAGQPAAQQEVLAAPVTYLAGQIAPVVYPQSGISIDAAGQSLPAAVTPVFFVLGQSAALTTAAAWVVPKSVSFLYDVNGNYYFPGNSVPAGTELISGGGNLPTGYIIPADVFPNGVPIEPVTVNSVTGQPLLESLTFPVGTSVQAGAVFDQTVTFQPLLNLSPALFSTGFSAYNVTGLNGVTVAARTVISSSEPVYRFTTTSADLATGAAPGAALNLWTPPLYQPAASTAVLTQRAGASLTLAGGLTNGANGGAGPVDIGAGALVAADPGEAITIVSPGQITIDGTLRAPGGAISINDGAAAALQNMATYQPSPQSIWVGNTGVLDVAARAFTTLDHFGRPYGVVPSGGTITLGAAGDTFNNKTGLIDSTIDFIVIQSGAVLDASGASAVLDPSAGIASNTLDPVAIANSVQDSSSGGVISLSSYQGMVIDGTLKAAAGGRGATGGSLAVTLETPNDWSTIPAGDPSFVPRIITIGQTNPAAALPSGLQPGAASTALQFGEAGFGASALEASGFGALAFTARDAIVFDGAVNLFAARSIAFHEGTIGETSTSATVAITAPVVTLDGQTPIDSDFVTARAGLGTHQSNQRSVGIFLVNADLIDIANQLAFGVDSPALVAASGLVASGTLQNYDFAGFGVVNLKSRGDVRFVTNPGPSFNNDATSTLTTSGSVAVTAAQLYPALGDYSAILSGIAVTRGAIIAGYDRTSSNNIITDPSSVITVAGLGRVPAMPYAIGGTLSLTAGTIDQGGVIRSPRGQISLNANQINLLPGSLTSASMNGLTMIVGGTVDGANWSYGGGTLLPGGALISGNAAPAVTLTASAIDVSRGAVIDISGGGDIAGAGFITGEGGSVNVLTTPLVNANPTDTYSAATGQVYAIVPGYQSGYAPVDQAAGVMPAAGQQVTITDAVPGLAAGTYTLLPAGYALLPGAFRVELGPTIIGVAGGNGTPTGNGGYLTEGTLSTAGTSVVNALPTRLVVMAGAAVRDNSNFDETNYSSFELKLAAAVHNVRPILPVDGGVLNFDFNASLTGAVVPALMYGGTALFAPGTDPQSRLTGQPGQVVASSLGNAMLVYAQTPRASFQGVQVSAVALSALGAPSLQINSYIANQSNPSTLEIGAGVVLRAGQVDLLSGPNSTLMLDPGATIDTIGQALPPIALSGDNAIVQNQGYGELIVSNAQLGISYAPGVDFRGNLIISNIVVGDGVRLYSEGSIGFAAGGAVQIADSALFGTRNISFSGGDINIGDPAAIAKADTPTGLNLTQVRVNLLLAGDPALGVPALRTLTLTASNSLNLFGTVNFNTADPAAGMAGLNLVLSTPAIYGYGAATDAATLTVGTLTWAGLAASTVGGGSSGNVSAAPGPVIPNGPGTGTGTLNVVANQIYFGFPADVAPDGQTTYNRVTYGFSRVNLIAPEITSSNRNTLAVYLAPNGDPAGPGLGGVLNLETSLLTGSAGAVMGFSTGGPLTIAPPAGGAPAGITPQALGSEIDLSAGTIDVSSTVLLPSGKITMDTQGDIVLNPGATLDLAGRGTTLVDQTEYGFGGTVILKSTAGNITEAKGAVIDVSAVDGNAGAITAQAISAGAGAVALDGTLFGSSAGIAGGARGGTIAVDAQTLSSGTSAGISGDFAALDAALNAGGFSWSRSFDLKQGDLAIGAGLVAHRVDVSVDNGALTVNGTVDASGQNVGIISLAAAGDLTVDGRLDTHGTSLVIDSYGLPIDAENTGQVSLTTVAGLLTLAPGAVIDVSVTSVQGVQSAALGDVQLNAPRTGGIGGPGGTGAGGPANAAGDGVAITAPGGVVIKGAAEIALNALATYANAPTDAAIGTGQLITQVFLDQINIDSRAFMTNAGANPTLARDIAGLSAYGGIFHLRPGVEIVSAGPDGNLTVASDLDLSGYRYSDRTGYGRSIDPAVLGSGEPGVLVLRAGGDLDIHGSITDGFAPPPASPDDRRWLNFKPAYIEAVTTHPRTNVTLAENWTIPIDRFYLKRVPTIYANFTAYSAGQTVPAGSVIDVTGNGSVPFAWQAGITVPATEVPAPPRRIDAIAPMLPAGDLSWSFKLTAGADTNAAGTAVLRPLSQLAGGGNLTLIDPNVYSIPAVLRTGAGSLDLAAGGQIDVYSQYGVYTAGSQSFGIGHNGADPYNLRLGTQQNDPSNTVLGAGNQRYNGTIKDYSAYYPAGGGNLTLTAQDQILGNFTAGFTDSNAVSNWLWRQGGAIAGQATAWWINFGTYTAAAFSTPNVIGFSGFGTLGGGNVTVTAGGDIPAAFTAVVGSTGRVLANGTLLETGGGALNIDVGGVLNGGPSAQEGDGGAVLVDTRGNIAVTAGAVGSVVQTFGTGYNGEIDGNSDPRYVSPLSAESAQSIGGVLVDPGDGTVSIASRGDLVLQSAGDPGRNLASNTTPFIAGGQTYRGGGETWFSLWTSNTAVDLFTAGGNLSPSTNASRQNFGAPPANAPLTDRFIVFPPTLNAIAASGSIYFPEHYSDGAGGNLGTSLIELAPSPTGQLNLLAANSIYGAAIAMSGADPSLLSSPFNPAFLSQLYNAIATYSNLNPNGDNNALSLFAFGPDTPTSDLHAADPSPIRIYATTGDIVGLDLGAVLTFSQNINPNVWYLGAKSASIVAGRDIVLADQQSATPEGGYSNTNLGFILNRGRNDISLVSAGRDILYSNFSVGGPGQLVVQAGGNYYAASQGLLTSIGPIVDVTQANQDSGAGITLLAGIGAAGPDYPVFANAYLNPADSSAQLAGLIDYNSIVRQDDATLQTWLRLNYGYTGSAANAYSYFETLPAPQRDMFLQLAFFHQLDDGGLAFNDPSSPHYKSYILGQDAIATLFPAKDNAGQPITYNGDITMFGPSGIQTLFGGNINTFTPGGATTVGVQEPNPPGTAGVITEGSGAINMFALDSVELGQSRVLTTFGGNIVIWSATGNIDAGLGKKTTVVPTPPRLTYDIYGDITLAPNVPSTGAGIGTLSPVAQVPPGNIDLVAPQGTVNAGEAGIRVSGNFNIAALHVENAANIQVKGTSTGIATAPAPDVGGLTSASNAAGAAMAAATKTLPSREASELPSIWLVEVLGYGGVESDDTNPKERKATTRAGNVSPASKSL